MSRWLSLAVAVVLCSSFVLAPAAAPSARAMAVDGASGGVAPTTSGARPWHPGDLAPDLLPGPEPLLPAEPTHITDPKVVEAVVTAARAKLTHTQQTDPYAVIDQCVADEMAATNTPGASMAIAIDGAIAYTKGYGVKHKENGGQIGPNTMFRIGSTTKMMTAAALMTLVDEGTVDLDEPVTTYVPELAVAAPWDTDAITSRHLLTHSGALPDTYLAYDEASLDALTLELWAYETLPYTPLTAPPGTFWNYSNPNFSLAGLVVQEMTGQVVTDYIEDAVWEPAGMPLSTFRAEDVIAHGDYSYGHYGTERLTPDRWTMPALAPAGTAFSTPTELATWALTLMDGGRGVISAESARSMQSRQMGLGYVPGRDYGFGIFVSDYSDVADPTKTVTVYDHAGNVQGFSSQLYWVPERGIAVSILANTITSLSASAHCVLRELGAVVPKDPGDQTTDPSTWTPYEGVYAVMNQVLWDFTYRVERTGSRLVMSNLDLGGSTPLAQVYRDTFWPDMDGNGEPDPQYAVLDYTFIREKDQPDRVPWIRNRLQVGQRIGQFPAELPLTGTECGVLQFTPEIDMPELAVSVSGLVPPGGTVLPSLPITQTSAADPATAAYKGDLEIRGEAGMLMLVVVPQAGDNLELYLLDDGNEDTQFTYPAEVIGKGLPGNNNIRALLMPGRQPGGRYQVWVHGTVVGGPGHTFTLQIVAVDGQNLTLTEAPDSARAGQPGRVRVCPQGVESLTGPMTGLVEFDYGWPPRRVRIPVSWQPAVATRSIYLPAAVRTS